MNNISYNLLNYLLHQSLKNDLGPFELENKLEKFLKREISDLEDIISKLKIYKQNMSQKEQNKLKTLISHYSQFLRN